MLIIVKSILICWCFLYKALGIQLECVYNIIIIIIIILIIIII